MITSTRMLPPYVSFTEYNKLYNLVTPFRNNEQFEEPSKKISSRYNDAINTSSKQVALMKLIPVVLALMFKPISERLLEQILTLLDPTIPPVNKRIRSYHFYKGWLLTEREKMIAIKTNSLRSFIVSMIRYEQFLEYQQHITQLLLDNIDNSEDQELQLYAVEWLFAHYYLSSFTVEKRSKMNFIESQTKYDMFAEYFSNPAYFDHRTIATKDSTYTLKCYELLALRAQKNSDIKLFLICTKSIIDLCLSISKQFNENSRIATYFKLRAEVFQGFANPFPILKRNYGFDALTLKEQDILKSYFGLFEKTLSLSQLAEKYQQSEKEMTTSIDKIIRRFRQANKTKRRRIIPVNRPKSAYF